jgi:hypothetical protein
MVLEQDQALPGEGEPEASAVALGGDAGVLGMQMSERTGERGGSGLFIWRGGLGGRRGWSWRSGLALAKMGGGVSVLDLGVCCERVLEGCGWPGAPRRMCQPIGHIHARRCSMVAEVV